MSFLQQVQISLFEGALLLICLSDGSVVFVHNPAAPAYYSLNDQGVSSYICPECFALWLEGEEPVEFEYKVRYNYRQYTRMLQWLQELNLQNPFTGEFRCKTSA